MPARHVQFLLAMVAVAPAAAIAGVSAGGGWAPLGVGLGAALVALTAGRSAATLRTGPRSALNMRMLGLALTVSAFAALLTLGAAAYLAIELVG